MKYLSLLSRSLEGGLFAAALTSTFFFLWVVAGNLEYPIGFGVVQWHILETVQRVYDGLPIYLEPSMEYIPELYTPLYYYITALVSWFFGGVGLLPGKLVSVAAMLGSGVGIYLWLRKENISALLSFAGAALFFAFYIFYSFLHYMVRVDALFCFLMVAGFALLYCGDRRMSAILAAVMLWLAFMTKQSALMVLGPVMLAYFIFDQSTRSRDFILASLILLASSIALFSYTTDGWFWYFVFELPSDHPLNPRQWVRFWREMYHTALPAIVVSLAAIATLFWTAPRKKAVLYGVLFVALFVCSYSMRLHSGGERNTYMPACLALAVLAPLAFKIENLLCRIVFLLLVATQFFILGYDPYRFTPSGWNIARGHKYLEYLGNIKGDILVEGGGFYPTRVGMKTYNLNTSFWDIERTNDEHLKKKLHDEFRAAVAAQKFAAIITYFDDPDRRYVRFKTDYDIAKYYRFKEVINDRLPPEEMSRLNWDRSKQRFRQYMQPRYVFVPIERPAAE